MSAKARAVLIEKSGLTKEAIVLFADAIFSIAITLLVLDIRLPALPPGQEDAAFLGALGQTVPSLAGFAVSFFVIALFWRGFHRMTRNIRKFDQLLLWLTLIFLFTIAIMPFPTAVLGAYGNNSMPIAFYQLTIAFSSLVMFAMWWHASQGHRLIDPDMDPRLIWFNTTRLLLPAFVMLITLPITFNYTKYAEVSWVIMIPLAFVIRRLFGVKEESFFE